MKCIISFITAKCRNKFTGSSLYTLPVNSVGRYGNYRTIGSESREKEP